VSQSLTKSNNDNHQVRRHRGISEANEALLDAYSGSLTRFCACLESEAPYILVDSQVHRRKWLEMTGRGVRPKIIIELTKENLVECSRLMEHGELRHLDRVRVSFIITDREFVMNSGPLRRGNPLTEITCVTDPKVVEEQAHLFEMLWEKAVPAPLRVAQLVQGVDIGETRVLNDYKQALLKVNEVVLKAREEILVLFPSEKVARRVPQLLNLLENRSSIDKLKVRALMPMPQSSQIAKDFPSIEWRHVEPGKLGLGVCDRAVATIVQYLNIEADNSENAMLSAFFTTYKQSVMGIRSMFETLWEESSLKEKEERERIALELSLEELRRAIRSELQSRRLFELLQDIMTHDLRNYSQVARLSAELIVDEVRENPKMRMLSDSLVDAIEGSTLLVERAKKLGIILGEEHPHLKSVDLIEVIEGSLESVKRVYGGKVIRHTIDIDRASSNEFGGEESKELSEPSVLADEMLSEVFDNIYSNATQYTPTYDVSIETRIEEAGPYWKVSISDEGSGIPAEAKREVLKRFKQIKKGSGIGLSIVYSLVVERYKGNVELRDRVAGDHTRGTTVEVWLQRA